MILYNSKVIPESDTLKLVACCHSLCGLVAKQWDVHAVYLLENAENTPVFNLQTLCSTFKNEMCLQFLEFPAAIIFIVTQWDTSAHQLPLIMLKCITVLWEHVLMFNPCSFDPWVLALYLFTISSISLAFLLSAMWMFMDLIVTEDWLAYF